MFANIHLMWLYGSYTIKLNSGIQIPVMQIHIANILEILSGVLVNALSVSFSIGAFCNSGTTFENGTEKRLMYIVDSNKKCVEMQA